MAEPALRHNAPHGTEFSFDVQLFATVRVVVEGETSLREAYRAARRSLEELDWETVVSGQLDPDRGRGPVLILNSCSREGAPSLLGIEREGSDLDLGSAEVCDEIGLDHL